MACQVVELGSSNVDGAQWRASGVGREASDVIKDDLDWRRTQ